MQSSENNSISSSRELLTGFADSGLSVHQQQMSLSGLAVHSPTEKKGEKSCSYFMSGVQLGLSVYEYYLRL